MNIEYLIYGFNGLVVLPLVLRNDSDNALLPTEDLCYDYSDIIMNTYDKNKS